MSPAAVHLPKPDICLFDLDGTLVEHKNAQLIAQLERFDTLIHILTKPFKRSSYFPVEMDLTVNVESNPLIHRIIHAIRIMRGIDVDDVVEPADGVGPFLDLLKNNGVSIGLTSNAYGRSYGKQILRKFGIRSYFDVILFREHVRHGKPHPESLLRAIHKFGLDKSRQQIVWFIGDQAKDMKAAIEAQKKLEDNIRLIPIAIGEKSTAAMFLNSNKSGDTKFNAANFTKNFAQLYKRLEKSLKQA